MEIPYNTYNMAIFTIRVKVMKTEAIWKGFNSIPNSLYHLLLKLVISIEVFIMSATPLNFTKISDFSVHGWNFLNFYMYSCLKRCVVFNHMSISSVGSIAYEKCLLTDLDRANTMYADRHVFRHICVGDDKLLTRYKATALLLQECEASYNILISELVHHFGIFLYLFCWIYLLPFHKIPTKSQGSNCQGDIVAFWKQTSPYSSSTAKFKLLYFFRSPFLCC